jgi:serine/threonine-protein kinase
VKEEDGRRMFVSEMQILASLEHANVVRSLASLEYEGQLVLVLEYLEGKTLRAILNERDLSWAEAVDVAAQIASALSAAHGQDTPIVHRDLKPENVMVLPDGTVKVMDFGIAKVLEHAHGKSTQSLGTLQYMSPEQIDARAIDGRTDLYALGLLLYEMIAGEPPFVSASPRELLNMQCTAEPPAFSEEIEAPAGVCELVFQLLAKTPEDRPADADEVLAALAPFRLGKKRSKDAPISSKRPRPAIATGPVTPSGTLRSVKRVDRHGRSLAAIEKVSAPREIRTRWAVAAIVLASIVSGGATYGIRAYQAKAKWAPKTDTTQTTQTTISQR